MRMGKLEQADEHFCISLKIKESVYGENHWQVARTLNGRAQLLFLQKRFEDAKPLCEKMKEMLEMSRGKDHSEVSIALDNVAR